MCDLFVLWQGAMTRNSGTIARNCNAAMGRTGLAVTPKTYSLWVYVGNKFNPRWIGYAVEHSTHTILAYVFGKRKDSVFKELKGCD